jgi:hypothetical protein
MFRKLWLGYFRASNASEALKNAKLVYQEHYERSVECAEGEIGSHMVGRQKVKENKVDHRKHDSNCKNMYARKD